MLLLLMLNIFSSTQNYSMNFSSKLNKIGIHAYENNFRDSKNSTNVVF